MPRYRTDDRPGGSRHALALLAGLCLPAACFGTAWGSGPGNDRYQSEREEMVSEYIEKEGIKNSRVLEAMRTIPRHEFVAPNLRKSAYTDAALPIGHKQTISPPFIVAYMTELVDPQPEDRVLEIGTGSGYQAAVLSPLVKDVYSIEIVEPLGRQAAQRLKRLGYRNVTTKVGDGYQGWPEHAPFDKILVTCSPEDVPKPLVEQLKEGGKMIVPLGERYQQVFYLFEKKDGKLVRTRLLPTLFVPMTGISEERRVAKPDPANPQVVNGGFELDADDNGRPDGWHYVRQATREPGPAPEGEHFVRFENSEPGRLSQILQGLAVDGRRVSKLRVRASLRAADIVAGPEAYQKPALVIHFYDDTRAPIGDSVVGPWTDTAAWTTANSIITVPARAREAIVRIGLNGAGGRLDVDNLQLTPERR